MFQTFGGPWPARPSLATPMVENRHSGQVGKAFSFAKVNNTKQTRCVCQTYYVTEVGNWNDERSYDAHWCPSRSHFPRGEMSGLLAAFSGSGNVLAAIGKIHYFSQTITSLSDTESTSHFLHRVNENLSSCDSQSLRRSNPEWTRRRGCGANCCVSDCLQFRSRCGTGHNQGRNEVRWRPGEKTNSAPPWSKFDAPIVKSEFFRRQIYCFEESTCDIVGTFRCLQQWFSAPIVNWRPGNCASLAHPSLHPRA